MELQNRLAEARALQPRGYRSTWKNRYGKTLLIAACMNDSLYTVAQTLIEFGADVNAYCEGLMGVHLYIMRQREAWTRLLSYFSRMELLEQMPHVISFFDAHMEDGLQRMVNDDGEGGSKH